MEGAARAANRRSDRDTLLAYRALQFYGLAMKGKLKAVGHYMIEKPKVKKQTAEQMLAILQQYADGGAPLTIREIN
jgi:hypothetical protein